MAKIPLDKYYTPPELAKYCIDKTFKVIGRENITAILEPSAGNGSFSKQMPGCIAIDIAPEDESILKVDFLKYDLLYIPGMLVIGNPPYGNNLILAQRFYKKAAGISDYISFILPIGQLNRSTSLYEFDLIHSEDLQNQVYSGLKLRCCLNVYKRPDCGINPKPEFKLKSVSFMESRRREYGNFPYDIRVIQWGRNIGRELSEGESYCRELKIKVNNKHRKQEILEFLRSINWKSYWGNVGNLVGLQTPDIVMALKKEFPELE